MMEDMLSFGDLRILEEELEDHMQDTYSAARFLELVEAEDLTAVEDALAILERCRVTLDVTKLPSAELTGSDALRLKQEADFETLEAITVGLEENDPLVLYLQELAAIPATGDVQMLAQCYLEGQHHLAERIMQLCLGLVSQLALEYTGHGVLLMDLIQEGNLGLWESLPHYEGGDFTAYVTWWIRHYMAKAVVITAHVNGVGSLLRQNMDAYLRADRELLTQLGRNPTREEIAQRIEMSLEDVLTLEKMMEDARAQEQVKQQTKEPEITPEDEQAVEDTAYFQLRQRVTELLATLTEQEAKLLNLRFGLEGGRPLTPEQAGKVLGMTPAQVVETEAAALAKLRTQ